jgi:hypothetical protein
MSLFDSLFGPKPFPPEAKDEVLKLIEELVVIGQKEDYLSVYPGGGYNSQCRHLRTRQIGARLYKIGGIELMVWVFERVRKKAGKVLASHLEYAWAEVGEWRA